MMKKTRKNLLCRKYTWEICFVYELCVYAINDCYFDCNGNIETICLEK